MIDYPFNKCLNPKQILNPYTKKPVTVSCGKCAACTLHKSSVNSLKCRLESLSHTYCMFVTLTYKDDYIPRSIPFWDEQLQIHVVKDNTPRLAKYKDTFQKKLCEVSTSQKDMNILKSKFNNNHIPYLCKKDLQLFIKRLRKNLSKYSNEKIRYYAIGEYGPKHFRPHFHLLIWFSEKETIENFNECLYKSWRFGRIDSQISRGSSANYVAGYLNSNCNLPQVLKSDSTKPFCVHSSRLGETILREKRKYVYNMDFGEIISSSIVIGNKLQDVFLWRSLETWFFPQCRDYSGQSFGGRKYALSIYAIAYEWTQEISPYRQAKIITQHYYEYGKEHFVPEYERLLQFFLTGQRFSTMKICRCDKDMYEQFFRSIYHDLYISKHFLHTVCDTGNSIFPTHEEINKKVQLIDDYYKYKDYNLLKRQMDFSNQLLESNLYTDEHVFFADEFHNPKSAVTIPYLYDNVSYDFNYFNETPLPRMLSSDVVIRGHQSVKHKIQNDLNNPFNNI